MRRRNTGLHTRVNGDLALDFGEVTLTSYAGLELFQRYLRTSGFNAFIRRAFRGASLGGDFGVCLPGPMLGRKMRACIPAACRVNADCAAEPGGYCAPVENPCCHFAEGLFCVYPSHGCRSSADCATGFCQPASEGAHCEPGAPACPA